MTTQLLRTTVGVTKTMLLNKKKNVSSTTSFTQSLTNASKVARILDWKKSSLLNIHILTIHITKYNIECAIASHPSSSATSMIQTLPSIPLKREEASPSSSSSSSSSTTTTSSSSSFFSVPYVTKALQDMIQKYNVCGIVVVYPTNQENGTNNAACGRVLHVLDHISLSTNTAGCSSSMKPICLYDPNNNNNNNNTNHHFHSEPDEWGRTSLYSTSTITTANVVRCDNTEQEPPHTITNNNNNTILQETWKNFVHQYWPNHTTITTTTPTTEVESDFFDDDNDDDLSDFIAQLSFQKSQQQQQQQHQKNTATTTTTFHHHHHYQYMNQHQQQQQKKNLVYQSAY